MPAGTVSKGLPEPFVTGAGGPDEVIELPSEEHIEAACVLQTQLGREIAEHGGNGFPKMPFGDNSFPDNLRLRPGYAFSQTSDKG